MEIKLPKISIVTPSFNQGKFIEKTILSVINQKYPNLEYIIIDGGSTDNSISIIKKYEEHLDYWVSEPDNGQSDAINKGFSKATGDIYYWINSDDYLLPNVLNIVGAYNWTKEIGAVVGIGHIIDVEGITFYTPKYYDPINTQSLYNWTNGKDFMQPACFFTKIAWKECGPLNINLHFCMDVDLWINISKKYKLKRINKDIAHAYTHENAKTTAEVEKMKLETFLMIASQGGFKESKQNLLVFYKRVLKSKLNSDAVIQHFSLKKLFKIVLKKIYLNFRK